MHTMLLQERLLKRRGYFYEIFGLWAIALEYQCTSVSVGVHQIISVSD